jgi:hypothetical protein
MPMSPHELLDSVQGFVLLGTVVYTIFDRFRLIGDLKTQFKELSESITRLSDQFGKMSERMAATEARIEIIREVRN